jgi:hypothetical protein
MKMRLLIFLLFWGHTLPESMVDRLPTSVTESAECDQTMISQGIHEETRAPRGQIFHYGKRSILLKNVSEGTIPLSDWNQFIMGNQTRFKLKRYRRGLYGTEFVEDADRFGDTTYDWVMEIRIKKECLKPSRASSLIELPKSKKFKNWFGERKEGLSLEVWSKKCFQNQKFPKPEMFDEYRNPGEVSDFSETVCEKVVADFYEDLRFAIIQDSAGDLNRSWYIRDRECIEKILGADDYWARAFAARDELWKNTCNVNRNHRNNIRVWFTALVNSEYRIEDLKKFSDLIRSLEPPQDIVDWQTDETDRFAAQDFGDTLESVARRCQKTKKNNFKEVLRGIATNVDELQSTDVKLTLESACR